MGVLGSGRARTWRRRLESGTSAGMEAGSLLLISDHSASSITRHIVSRSSFLLCDLPLVSWGARQSGPGADERDEVGTRDGRQRSRAASISLNAMAIPAAFEPGPS